MSELLTELIERNDGFARNKVFLPMLALKHLVIHVFFSGEVSVVGAKAQQPLGLLSIPNKLRVYMHTINLPVDIKSREYPVFAQANSSIVAQGWF